MSKAVRDFKPWPAGVPLPPGALTWFYHPGLDDEFSLDPARFGPPGGAAPAESISLDGAQKLELATPPAREVISNVLYAISADNWNGGKDKATVYVHGLKPGTFAPDGLALDTQGNYQRVRVSVTDGTFDTEAIRDLQLLVVEIDETSGDYTAWVGGAVGPDAIVEEHLIP